MDDPQFIRFDSQVTPCAPYWLFGTHSNLLVLQHVTLFVDGFCQVTRRIDSGFDLTIHLLLGDET
jgi:hypothetical protein